MRRLGRLRILSYIRELSVVMLGILATLTITDKVSEAARQKEIRESFLLLRTELQANLHMIERLYENHEGELRFYKLLQKHMDDIYTIPSDTLLRYNPMGYINEFYPVTDAYSVFKVSGLMQYARDRSLLSDLMQTYSALEQLQDGLSIYKDHKSNAIAGLEDKWSYEMMMAMHEAFEQGDLHPQYQAAIQHDKYRIFVKTAANIGIVRQTVEYASKYIEHMIGRIDEVYEQ